MKLNNCISVVLFTILVTCACHKVEQADSPVASAFVAREPAIENIHKNKLQEAPGPMMGETGKDAPPAPLITANAPAKGARRVMPPGPIPFAKGVNYVSWTTGDYPWTCSWKRQTYYDSQAITKVQITATKPYDGRGSLEATIEASSPSDTQSKGELFLDARYLSGYDSQSPVRVKRSADGRLLGIDLADKWIGAVVFCEDGTAGSSSAPSGLQLILKSVQVDAKGNEVWASYYTSWQNIWPTWGPDSSADKRLGDVREGQWSVIAARVPKKGSVSVPPYGYADAGFDPTQVALVGVKFGLNDNSRATCSGKRIWIDDLGFKDIVCEGNSTFDFSDVPHAAALKLWQAFGVSATEPFQLDYGTFFRARRTLRCRDAVVFRFEQVEDPVTSLAKNGFNFVGIVNTEYMADKTAVTIGPREGKSHSLKEMEDLITQVHRQGMRVMLKPHVDVVDDTWRGEIQPSDKRRWFESYRQFILRYAALAEATGVEMLCMGTEFKSLDSSNRQEWEEIIKNIREVFSGAIVYASNWDSFSAVCFWDLLNCCGIDAYHPLSSKRNPTLDDLVTGWSHAEYDMDKRQWGGRPVHWIAELESWQQKIGKDVLFTEIGYRSTDYAARAPWEYQEARPVNLSLQEACYAAVLTAFKDKPWFKGVFWWMWNPNQDAGGPMDGGFTPQNKPAARVFLDFK